MFHSGKFFESFVSLRMKPMAGFSFSKVERSKIIQIYVSQFESRGKRREENGLALFVLHTLPKFCFKLFLLLIFFNNWQIYTIQFFLLFSFFSLSASSLSFCDSCLVFCCSTSVGFYTNSVRYHMSKQELGLWFCENILV